jgi:HEAT repeat protein/Zn-dependent protease
MVEPNMRGIRILLAWSFAATALLSFWNVVRFIPTKVYTDGSGFGPSLIAKAVLISIFVAVGALFATAWWTVLRKRESARKWALRASFVLAFAGFLLLYAHPITLIEKGWLPLAVGVSGLAVFYRGRTTEQQRYISSGAVPSDGTNTIMDKVVVVLAILAVFGGYTFWSRWADAHGLSQNLPPFFYVRFTMTVLLIVVLHEGGHLFAGLALGMKAILVAIGPVEWSNSLGRRKLRVQAAFQCWFRGQTLVAPKYIQRFRERKILQVATGPFVSIATGMIAAIAVMMSLGSPWQGSWLILSRFATISLAVGIFNLIPFRIGPSGYSDGAKLFQLIKSGLWCRYHLLLGMTHASTVTPIRARDFDLATIHEAAGSIARGEDELFMHLCAYSHFFDKGELSNAATALVTAGKLCREASVSIPAEWITTFVFGTAFLWRDPVAARAWWTEYELKKSANPVIEGWTSYSALLWLEGRREEAEEAWRKADNWARQLPDSGFAAQERDAVHLLREWIDESPSAHTEKLSIAVPEPALVGSAPDVGPTKPLFNRFNRGWVLALVVFLLVLAPVALKRLPIGIHSYHAPNVAQQPYGKRSGADLYASWEAERRRESARYSDADLQRMVDRLYVQDDPQRANFYGLLYADARPLPFLLKALDDPRTSTTVFSGRGVSITDTSPFERICALLRKLRPSEAAKPLARYVDNPNPMFRRTAALLLASIGTRECLEPVKRALADKDHEVREYALIGLASKGRQRDEEFLSGLIPALIPMLSENFAPESPAKALMVVDPANAVPILESPRYFSTQNPQLAAVLEALNRPGVKVPRTILLPLLAKLDSSNTNESPEQVTYAAALTLYANNPDEHAENRFRTLINAPSAIISSAAAQDLETLAGINVRDVVMDVYDRRGFATMTQAQQFCLAVELYRDEVNDGGHKQYFYNDDSDLYEAAIAGLHAMGATSQATNLADVSRAFPSGHPAPTEGGRRDQLEAFGSDQDRILETADKRFYQLEKEPSARLDVLMTLYALKHRTDFAVPNE